MKKFTNKASITELSLTDYKNFLEKKSFDSKKFPAKTLPSKEVETIKGLNSPEYSSVLERLHEQSEFVYQGLDIQERNAINSYKRDAFRQVNAYLIGGSDYIQTNYKKRKGIKLDEETLDSLTRSAERIIPILDNIFKKYNPVNQENRNLYRSFRVLPPEGIKQTRSEDIKNFISENYKVGSIIANKSYTSTSLDPDFMLIAGQENSEQIIVHEIVSDKGLPLFRRFSSNNKSIQNAEKEILLPRDTQFKVVGVKEKEFISSYSSKEPLPFNLWGKRLNRKTFTVVQLEQI